MSSFNIPDKLITTGNLAENWRIFQQSLNIYLLATGLDKAEEERKIAILLNLIGEEGIKIYNNFSGSKTTYKEVIQLFHEYCEPKKNILHSRFLFFHRDQEIDEPFDEYMNDIIKLAKDCQFKCNDEAIRDRLVLGTSDKETQQKLVIDGDVTLEAVTTRLRMAEISRKQVAALRPIEQHNIVVNEITTKLINCKWCGKKHEANIKLCPARGKTCMKCSRKNHFASVCKSRQVKNVQQETPCNSLENNEEDNEYYCNNIQKKKRNDLNKLNYDKNSKINNSKFEKGQKIVFLKDNVWVPANIVEPHSSPRSFLIKDAAGNVLRRNTSQLKPSNTDVTINEELTDCPVQYDENLHNSELQNPVPDQPVSTSGRPKRTVRPPAYLNDYYTSIPSREDV
ncbi:hypothetical protein ACJJTC_006063 [Scirpophaga incertulas]